MGSSEAIFDLSDIPDLDPTLSTTDSLRNLDCV